MKVASERRIQKRVPFTVVDVVNAGEIHTWRAKVEARSSVKRAAIRDKAIVAFMTPDLTTVNGRQMSVADAYKLSGFKNYDEKPSLWSRIYSYCMNLFLDIYFN